MDSIAEIKLFGGVELSKENTTLFLQEWHYSFEFRELGGFVIIKGAKAIYQFKNLGLINFHVFNLEGKHTKIFYFENFSDDYDVLISGFENFVSSDFLFYLKINHDDIRASVLYQRYD